MSDPVYSEKVTSQPEPFAAHERAAIFQSKELLRVSEKLNHLINFSNLLLLVTGDKGSGKSTVLDHVAAESQEELTICRIVASKHLSVSDIVASLAATYSLKNEGDKSLEAISDLVEALDESISMQRRVLFIDAADQLLPEVLSYLGQLNLAQKNLPEPELSIVLFADSSLNNVVTETVFKDLGSEGIHRIELKGLRSDEIEPFIDTICKHSELHKSPFNSEQIKSVIAQSRGNPLKAKQSAGELLRALGPAAFASAATADFDDDFSDSDMDGELDLGALDDDIDIDADLDNLDELASLEDLADLDSDGPLLGDLPDVPEIPEDLLGEELDLDNDSDLADVSIEDNPPGDDLLPEDPLVAAGFPDDDALLVDVGLLDDDGELNANVDIDEEPLDIDDEILEVEEEDDLEPTIEGLNPELDDYDDDGSPTLDLNIDKDRMVVPQDDEDELADLEDDPESADVTAKIALPETETLPESELTAEEEAASPFMDEPPSNHTLFNKPVESDEVKASGGSSVVKALGFIVAVGVIGGGYHFYKLSQEPQQGTPIANESPADGEEELSMLSSEELSSMTGGQKQAESKPDEPAASGQNKETPAAKSVSDSAEEPPKDETTKAQASAAETSSQPEPKAVVETPKKVQATADSSQNQSPAAKPKPEVAQNEPVTSQSPQAKTSTSEPQPAATTKPEPAKPVVSSKPTPKPAPSEAISPAQTEALVASSDGELSDADLAAAGPSAVTLQLAGFSRESGAQQMVKKYPSLPQLRYYQRQLRGKPYFVVINGFYASRADANAAKAELPEALRNVKPWVKPLSSVKKERDSAQ